MKNLKTFSLILILISGLGAQSVFAHCEIPCGIYNDTLRADLIAEHIMTIEKSINQINALRQAEDKNYNQLIRWVNNKEQHANELQHIVTQYFMTQRIKPVTEEDPAKKAKYDLELSLLHELLVWSMKAKQTTDLKTVEKLRETLKAFRESYFGEHGHSHE
ncbi:superoxide dismutase [bacterium]|nr:superoxide dismutase [bacterium]